MGAPPCCYSIVLLLEPDPVIAGLRVDFGLGASVNKAQITLVYPFMITDCHVLYNHIQDDVQSTGIFL